MISGKEYTLSVSQPLAHHSSAAVCSEMSIIAIVEEAIHLLAADARDMPSSLVVIFYLSRKLVYDIVIT